jgi:hypothetical protein
MSNQNKTPITQLIELYVEKANLAYDKHLETMHTDIKSSEKFYDRFHIIGNLKQQLIDEFLVIERNYILELINELKSTTNEDLISSNEYFNNDFWRAK